MLAFLFLAFIASFASFHFAKHRLRTPLIANFLGSFCTWAAVFSLGAAFAPASGPWARSGDETLDLSPYMTAMKYLALAALAFGMAHLLQRALGKSQERNSND